MRRWVLQPPSIGWGGGGECSVLLFHSSPCLASKLIGGARSTMQRSKGLKVGILMQFWNFLYKGQMSGQGQVKGDSFYLISYRDQTRDSCNSKLCQSANKGMMKMPYKQGAHAKHKLRSISDQIRTPNENIVWVFCDTWFMGHLGCQIWCWHLFSHLTQGKVKFR